MAEVSSGGQARGLSEELHLKEVPQQNGWNRCLGTLGQWAPRMCLPRPPSMEGAQTDLAGVGELPEPVYQATLHKWGSTHSMAILSPPTSSFQKLLRDVQDHAAAREESSLNSFHHPE